MKTNSYYISILFLLFIFMQYTDVNTVLISSLILTWIVTIMGFNATSSTIAQFSHLCNAICVLFRYTRILLYSCLAVQKRRNILITEDFNNCFANIVNDISVLVHGRLIDVCISLRYKSSGLIITLKRRLHFSLPVQCRNTGSTLIYALCHNALWRKTLFRKYVLPLSNCSTFSTRVNFSAIEFYDLQCKFQSSNTQ